MHPNRFLVQVHVECLRRNLLPQAVFRAGRVRAGEQPPGRCARRYGDGVRAAGSPEPRVRDDLVEIWTEVAGRPVRSLSLGRLVGLPEAMLLPGLGAPFYIYPWMREI